MKKLILFIFFFSVNLFANATVHVVDSLNDSSYGSLRAAADSCVAGDTIRFNSNLIANGSDSIVLTSGEIDFDSIGVVIKGLYNATDTLKISGNDSSRIFSFNGAGRVVLDSLVLVNGNASLGTGAGGAVLRLDCTDTLFVLNSVISGNTASGNGGGISSSFMSSPSAVFVTNSIISGNTASGKGGGVYSSSVLSTSFVHVLNTTISGNIAVTNGGGIYSELGSSSVLVENSTISGNTAYAGGGIYSSADYTWPTTIVGVLSDVVVTNSTVSGNTALTTGAGGILSSSFDTSSVDITNSTLYGNISPNGDGGVYSGAISSSIITITSSIIAENGANSSGINNNAWSSATTILSGGYNIFSDTLTGSITSDSSNVTAAQLNLQPLSFNGGTTQTMMPGFGSYALDNGNPNDNSNAQNAPIVGTRNVGAAENCYSGSSYVSISQCSAYTVPSGNFTYSQSGVYNDTIITACGADSITTIYLTINSTFETINVFTCDSFTSPSGNYVWTSSGTYMDTIPNAVNCDSIITLILTVNNPTSSTISAVGCDSYTSPSGNYVWTSSGIYMDTIANVANCDSIITMNLTINNSTTAAINVVSCDSYISPSGNYTWTSSNTYLDTISNAVNCDSIITINLTINNSHQITDVISACDSYTWINGVTYTSSNNTATQLYANTKGCDSLVTLDLTINSTLYATDVIIACVSYNWNGVTFTSSNNTTIDSLQSVAGCDSIVTLDLTILQSSTGTAVVSACDSYTWNGLVYTASNNIAQDTLVNAVGCDSIVTLDLTILNSTSSIQLVTACDSYIFNGVTYTASNYVATQTFVNAVGCDSVITLNLTINNSHQLTDVISACDSYTWINGVTYTSSNNTATKLYTNANGCDSLITLDLTIYATQYANDVITACGSYIWNGVTYNSHNNTAKDTLQTIAGCDSIVTLNLTILQPSTGIAVVSACDSYTWNGLVYYANNNIAQDTLVNAVGCDSIVTLDLTILNSTSSIQSVTACNSYIFNGVTYTSSNTTATQTLVNALGCDSVVILDLTINYSTSFTDVIIACDSMTWMNGVTYYQDTIDNYVMTNSTGCDSVITLDLTINQSSSSTDSVIAVNQFTWIDGSTYYGSNTKATHVLQTINGCDSVVTLNLHIEFVEIGVHANWPNLFSQATFGTFQWVECPNYDIIPGATDSVFTPTQNGSYAVIVTQNGFTDTSDCIMVTNVGIQNVELIGVSVYPNPTSDILHIDKGSNAQLEITITNSVGARVHQSTSQNQITTINMVNMATGMYVVTLRNELGLKVEKVVKR